MDRRHRRSWQAVRDQRHGPQLGTPDAQPLFGMGTPRGLQKAAEALARFVRATQLALIAVERVCEVLTVAKLRNSGTGRRCSDPRGVPPPTGGEIIEIRVFQRAATPYIPNDSPRARPAICRHRGKSGSIRP